MEWSRQLYRMPFLSQGIQGHCYITAINVYYYTLNQGPLSIQHFDWLYQGPLYVTVQD